MGPYKHTFFMLEYRVGGKHGSPLRNERPGVESRPPCHQKMANETTRRRTVKGRDGTGAEVEQNYCPNCGQSLKGLDGPPFCPGCGHEILVPAKKPEAGEDHTRSSATDIDWHDDWTEEQVELFERTIDGLEDSTAENADLAREIIIRGCSK